MNLTINTTTPSLAGDPGSHNAIPYVLNVPYLDFSSGYRELAEGIDFSFGNGNGAIEQSELSAYFDAARNDPALAVHKNAALEIVAGLRNAFLPKRVLWPATYDIELTYLMEAQSPDIVDTTVSNTAKRLLDMLPEAAVRRLREAGVSLVETTHGLGDFFKDIDSFAINERQDLSETAALYNMPSRQIIIRDDLSPHETEHSLAHELGHAMDDVFGLATSQLYQDWYAQNVAALDPYEQQAGIVGLRESFAERFREYLVEPKVLKEKWPEIAFWFDKIFKS